MVVYSTIDSDLPTFESHRKPKMIYLAIIFRFIVWPLPLPLLCFDVPYLTCMIAFRYFFKQQYYLVPSPSETWFWGMIVEGSFRLVYDRTHLQEVQPAGYIRDSAGRLGRGGGLVG